MGKQLFRWLLILAIVVNNQPCSAQTYMPSCFSNARGFQIQKISRNSYNTVVELKYISGGNTKTFHFHPYMYITDKTGNSKYYVTRSVNYTLNTSYTLQPYTEYDFTLEFQKIPDYWTEINIIEPSEPNATAWYWKNIVLGDPSTKRYNIDQFFLDQGILTLAGMAHTFNTFSGYRYCVESSNKIWVDIYYKSGERTELEITKSDNYFSRINVLQDTDEYAPFAAANFWKNAAIGNAEKYESQIERVFAKGLSAMTGKEFACAVLSVEWWTH